MMNGPFSADPDTEYVECIEVYIPKKLDHQSELYNFLRSKLESRHAGETQSLPIHGFSLYEVDGAFIGDRIYEERTIVIRILFTRNETHSTAELREKIVQLGKEMLAAIAYAEEELWICHYRQQALIFRMNSRAESQDETAPLPEQL
ncbi:MAG: hypothetical protein U0136_13210 [Bdellovibrionota bacterium]